MSTKKVLGFIGLGVMGEPICRNIARKSGLPMIAFDVRKEPLERLAADGVKPAAAVETVATDADIIFMALPGGPQVEAVVAGPRGILAKARAGQIIVDLSTTPVGLTRQLAARCAERGVDYADAPIARTRQAAQDGTLSIMVGATPALFDSIRPLLAMAGTDVTHCMVRPCVARRFVELAVAVLHQCIRPLIGALLRAIMDISAPANSLAERPQRAKWVTSDRMRWEDRTSISSHLLADLGR